MKHNTRSSSFCVLRVAAWDRLFLSLLLVVLASSLFACGESGGGGDTNNGVAGEPDCTEGFLGCTCIAGTACWPGSGWVCLDGVCAEPTCEVGTLGCACFANNSCDRDEDGVLYECSAEGLCQLPSCPLGSQGCPCDAGVCQDDLACVDSVCDRLGCVAGENGCACLEGEGCSGALVCLGNVCTTAPDCELGAEGCLCGPGDTCADGLICKNDACEALENCVPGALGCSCVDGACSDPDHYCDGDERCQAVDCPEGEEGCACSAMDVCGFDADNNPLVCETGICRREACLPGQPGCACLNGYSCAEGNLCDEEVGLCRPEACRAGLEHCPCAGGGCGVGLVCLNNTICASNEGYVGGLCLEGERCNPGGRCLDGSCIPCVPGSQACSCDGDGACRTGLTCVADLCVAETALEREPPAAPFCVTPCSSDYVRSDGTIVECNTDGLLEDFCPEGKSCVEGSCVGSGQSPRACFSSVDCPDYQACINGQCYSDCRVDDDCASLDPSMICHSYVCRFPCHDAAACPSGMSCNLVEGAASGVCVELVVPDEGEAPVNRVEANFEVSALSVSMTNVSVTGSFQIINNSAVPQRFQLKKLSDAVYSADAEVVRSVRQRDGLVDCTGQEEGCACLGDEQCGEGFACRLGACRPLGCPAGTCPMFWLEMAERGEDPQRSQEMEVLIEAGRARTIELTNSDGSNGVRWSGVLEVSNQELGAQRLQLDYHELPEGQWSGSLYYFASFGTRGLTPEDSECILPNTDLPRVLCSESNPCAEGMTCVNGVCAQSCEGELEASDCGGELVCVKGGCCQRNAWLLKDNPAPGASAGSWVDTRDDAELQGRIGNALVQRWGAFRRGAITWDDFMAALTATRTGSWNYANVREDCPVDACYLYELGADGLAAYALDLDATPIPSDATELPLVMNLRLGEEEDGRHMDGRVVSNEALQYAGFPSVNLAFDGDPSACSRETPSACVVFVEEMEAQAFVGGRYLTDAEDTSCAERPGQGFVHSPIPWLVPGFTEGTSINTPNAPTPDQRYRWECRDGLLPFASQGDAELEAENLSLSLSNPIPDGRSRRRTFKILDGALINQSQLFLLFEENFESFLGDDDPEGFSAFGYIILSRNPVDLPLDDEDGDGVQDAYQGTDAEDARPDPARSLLEVACGEEILEQVFGSGGRLRQSNADTLVQAILSGVTGDAVAFLDEDSQEQAHYLCVDTGLFNGGPDEFATPPTRVSCPAESEVIYFTMESQVQTRRQLAGQACQSDGSCLETLNRWRENDLLVQDPPVWRCANEGEVYCDTNRLDLTADKRFFAVTEQEAVFVPLQSVIDDAFRYKTRFQSRRGENPGFAPEICQPGGSDSIPYCYDPEQITSVFQRTDCLLEVWGEEALYGALEDDTRERLNRYLEYNFSFVSQDGVSRDGFEFLNAELLIMLGDESYTSASASRFDLAGASNIAFEGSLFEEGGGDLSGIVGYEMYKLYQAAQYYQMVLDRFYSQSPLIWRSLEIARQGDGDRSFVGPATVTRYFDRLVRASAQKSKVWAEIAKRYQQMNRVDLARRVSERAYTATWLESVIMARMILRIIEVSTPEDRAQVQEMITSAQLRYRSALLDMQEVHSTLTDELTFFGYAPDYIPFPPLDSGDINAANAFELLQRRVEAKMSVAAQREQVALEQSRSFDTDQAQFQSELTQIKNTYENQLADLCGTFEGEDGRIYPAIEKYAYLSEETTLFGNPCGLAGNGAIHNQRAEIELAGINIQAVLLRYQNVLSEVDIEVERVSAQCDEIVDRARYNFEISGQQSNLEQEIRDNQFIINRIQSGLSLAGTLIGYSVCSSDPTQCAQSGVAAFTYGAAHLVAEGGISLLELEIQRAERGISGLNRESAAWNTLQECDVARIDSNARTSTLLLQLQEIKLEVLRSEYQFRLALAELQRLQNQATRLEAEQKEAEELSINVQAAHNNPNVRIYKNDSIINAEVSFDDAIREVYRLTRVFEYYTSQSYARKGDLFLIRMVQRGDPNLENYVSDLINAFYEFEELFGVPDTRAQIISLRDDIFLIPRLDEEGDPISQSERYRMFQSRLTDVSLLDSNGYITIPFSTGLNKLSPLTRNHKILYLEVDLYGSDNGDAVGRAYVRQRGTGVIHTVNDEVDYYRFDERTAVVNTIFNGNRYFETTANVPGYYKTYRLRDRPMVNTGWELILNQRDEEVNQDINLAALNDIRIYIYYGDVTALDE